MNLSERKKKILSAVIDENFLTAEPVSSKQLQENYLKDFSSATIRNELATLEELGLLYHPHTSSGRLPTKDGIKLYVDEILPSIKSASVEDLTKMFDAKLDNVSSVLKTTAKAISEATNYTTIMSLSLYDFAIIEKVGLVGIDENSVLAIVSTDRGTIKDLITLEANEEELESSSKILTDIFRGKTLRQIENSDFLITSEIEKYKYMFELMVEMIASQEKKNNQIAIEGKNKLLEYPEFADSSKLRSAFEIFEEPSSLESLLDSTGQNIETIIETDENSPVKDCAIVTASYKVGDKTIGKASVFGPVRMDYKNVISILKGLSSEISHKLNQPNKNNSSKKGDD
ncbi:MAG: heat-inducible transcription repressor HrcA [Clostridia bacterium]|nr:heat-inducible transcription repressor HrcA [Clostridia bacterium]